MKGSCIFFPFRVDGAPHSAPPPCFALDFMPFFPLKQQLCEADGGLRSSQGAEGDVRGRSHVPRPSSATQMQFAPRHHNSPASARRAGERREGARFELGDFKTKRFARSITALSRRLLGGEHVDASCDLAASLPRKQPCGKRSEGEKREGRICLCYPAHGRRKIKPFRNAFEEAVFSGKHGELQTQLRI